MSDAPKSPLDRARVEKAAVEAAASAAASAAARAAERDAERARQSRRLRRLIGMERRGVLNAEIARLCVEWAVQP